MLRRTAKLWLRDELISAPKNFSMVGGGAELLLSEPDSQAIGPGPLFVGLAPERARSSWRSAEIVSFGSTVLGIPTCCWRFRQQILPRKATIGCLGRSARCRNTRQGLGWRVEAGRGHGFGCGKVAAKRKGIRILVHGHNRLGSVAGGAEVGLRASGSRVVQPPSQDPAVTQPCVSNSQ